MKENKQHHENDTRSRWVNTDVLSSFLPHFYASHTERWREEKMRGEVVGEGRGEEKGKLEKRLRPGSCPTSALGSRTHQIRRTQRTFVWCFYTLVGRRGAVLVFGVSLVIKLLL